MRLTRHFINNWYERVGNHPTEAMIRGIIINSIRVQKGKKLRKLNGLPFTTLTIYWHPDLKLILQIDCFNNAAVSVLSNENKPNIDKRQAQANYTPLTMHNI